MLDGLAGDVDLGVSPNQAEVADRRLPDGFMTGGGNLIQATVDSLTRRLNAIPIGYRLELDF